MGAAAWSQLAVLSAGCFFGSVCKGITGFGSAVILVAFWVVASMAGIEAGQPHGAAELA